jgi:H+-transporting ATPase
VGSFLDGFSLAPKETGLTKADVDERLQHFGVNELEEKKENIILKFLGYFWGPMPAMIMVACAVEFLNMAWPDLGVLLVLLIVNGLVGFVEERNAGSAIAALKASLTPMCTVRDLIGWSSDP